MMKKVLGRLLLVLTGFAIAAALIRPSDDDPAAQTSGNARDQTPPVEARPDSDQEPGPFFLPHFKTEEKADLELTA